LFLTYRLCYPGVSSRLVPYRLCYPGVSSRLVPYRLCYPGVSSRLVLPRSGCHSNDHHQGTGHWRRKHRMSLKIEQSSYQYNVYCIQQHCDAIRQPVSMVSRWMLTVREDRCSDKLSPHKRGLYALGRTPEQ
jgi:hypothetical protein